MVDGDSGGFVCVVLLMRPQLHIAGFSGFSLPYSFVYWSTVH